MSTRPPVRLVLVGAEGRMGSRVRALADDDRGVLVVGALTRGERGRERSTAGEPDRTAPRVSHEIAAFSLGFADVVVDFSSPEGTLRALDLARQIGSALLVGTTGLPPATLAALRDESARRAVLHAPNTSLGVAVIAEAVRRVASRLVDFDASIVESHHSAKRDAPSGTALRLARAARDGGARLPDQQVVSIRGGDVVGEHTVRFAGPGEYVELTHRATSRDVFVVGALRAAVWLAAQQPGWWTIEDMLGIDA